MSKELDNLEALARAAGGEQWEYWHSEHKCMGGVATASGEDVTIGNMDVVSVEPDKGKFIAAANPAALLALTAQIRQLTAERNDLITQRNAANVRALKAEFPPVPGALRPQVDLLRRPVPMEQQAFTDDMPNDQLDDVLPLAPRKPLPLNLPASLDLPDTEGGAHD